MTPGAIASNASHYTREHSQAMPFDRPENIWAEQQGLELGQEPTTTCLSSTPNNTFNASYA
jgi:hypothetical protein